MTPEQKAAIEEILGSLVQFNYGPENPDTPYSGLVSISAKQYKVLTELVNG